MGLRKFKEFSGKGSFQHGIHPPENKKFSVDLPIEVMPPPDTIVMPLLQNLGAPCELIVKAKQSVAFGEMIGKGKGFVSSPIHSPVSGKVKKIGVSTLPNGRHLPAIFITAEGEQVSGQELWDDILGGEWPKDCSQDYSPDTISKAIHDAGIVGLGGATFPTHVKIMPDEKKNIDTLILNGCECEPFLTSDYRLMMEAPEAIIAGALLAGHTLKAKEIIIAIEDNKPKAIEKLGKETKGTGINVVSLKTKYPQGSEKQLIKAVLNREVPVGGLPADVGVMVTNVGTAAAIARSVIRQKPLTHRIISVSGAGITEPKNLLVPIGILAGEVIEFCGSLTDDAARIIAGGPMMGFAFSNFDTPVIKGTSGITVLTHEDIRKDRETNCVRCGCCVDACPMQLVPTKLAMAARYEKVDLAERYNIMACFECGSCTYVCPANIRLVQLIRTGKIMVAANKKQ